MPPSVKGKNFDGSQTVAEMTVRTWIIVDAWLQYRYYQSSLEGMIQTIAIRCQPNDGSGTLRVTKSTLGDHFGPTGVSGFFFVFIQQNSC